MFEEDVTNAKWTLDAEVMLDGFLIARLGYAQMPDGWLVEAGGWGDRNNLEVIRHGILNLHGVLELSGQHSFENRNGGVSTNWSCVTRKLYRPVVAKQPGAALGKTTRIPGIIDGVKQKPPSA